MSSHTLLGFNFFLTVHIPLFLPPDASGTNKFSHNLPGQSSGESQQHVGLKAQSQAAVGDQEDPFAFQSN